ncbi:MAG: tetratricopeptide repeat protein, partial [Anaerolineae bacterium]
MPTKPPSWRTVREQRRKENFVGRGEQLRVLTDNFAGDVPDHMVFVVTGEGGVGKSTLLLQYEAIARAHNAIPIICDDRQSSPVTAMGHIVGELAKSDFSHKEFNERYKKHRELRQELEGDAKVPRPLVALLARGVTDLTIKTLRRTPGVGVFMDYADEKAAGEAFAQLINLGIDRWGNKDEVRLLREPEPVLTPLFLELLDEVCARRRVVLMFDVFERTADTLSPWLLALFRFEYGEFNTHLTFVISGRDPLEQHWTELAGDLCRLSLEPFTPDETRLYLGNQHITDEQLVAQIHADTGGLPVLVELLAATRPQPGAPLADISKDAVERFLQWTPQEERRQAALLAAVPRQFNRDILSAALGSDATPVFKWLREQSYIRTSTERGCFYHERVRELMLRHLRQTTPGDLTAAHQRLAVFFADSQAQLDVTDKAAYDSESWRRLEKERVYHAVSVQPDRDITVGVNAFLHAFRWRWRFAENLSQVCRQVGEETRLRTAVEGAETLLATYHAYDRDDHETVIAGLDTLSALATLTLTSRCAIHTHRGETYRQMGQYALALADFDRAIGLDEKYAGAIARRGVTYQQMEQYARALADFDRAIGLDEKYAWAIANRGLTYRQMGQYALALADCDRAIGLDEKYAWAIANRGLTYGQMGQY